MKYLWLLLALFLAGCSTISSRESKIQNLEDTIQDKHELKLDYAAASAYATNVFLYEGDLKSARLTHEYTVNALPRPELYLSEKWDEVVDDIRKKGPDSGKLKKEYKNLIKLDKDINKLEDNLRDEKRELLYQLKDKISDFESKHNLASKLIYIFAGASILLTIAGIFSFKLDKSLSVNFFIAAAAFGFAAYYVTTTWFAYIAAIVAIIVLIGVAYMVVGNRKSKKTIRGIIKGFEKHRGLNPDEVRNLEVNLSRSLNSDEKALIKKEKKKIKHQLLDEEE